MKTLRHSSSVTSAGCVVGVNGNGRERVHKELKNEGWGNVLESLVLLYI